MSVKSNELNIWLLKELYYGWNDKNACKNSFSTFFLEKRIIFFGAFHGVRECIPYCCWRCTNFV